MKVVLCGYYGMGNGGDEALLATLLQMLPPEAEPAVLSGNPVETTQRYGVSAYWRKSPSGIWAALQGAHAFIWGGGSLMQDTTSALNPIYYGGLMLLAQAQGLKTLAWAQGVGPLQRRGSRWLTRKALQGCDGVSVRDRASAAMTTQWQVPAWVAPDPVWALASKPVLSLLDFPAPRVAVALRGHPWLTAARLEKFAAALANFQIATQMGVLLVPFQASKDLSIAQIIQPYLKGPSQIVNLTDPSQLKGIFRGVEMAITMRFHALVMAAAEGCQCFALSYDPKVNYVAEDLQIPGWELAPDFGNKNQPQTKLCRWPDTPTEMTQQLLNHYANGSRPSPEQIQSRVDRASLHGELLYRTLGTAINKTRSHE